MTWQEQKKKLERETHLQDITKNEIELAYKKIMNGDKKIHSENDYWNLLTSYIDDIRKGD